MEKRKTGNHINFRTTTIKRTANLILVLLRWREMISRSSHRGGRLHRHTIRENFAVVYRAATAGKPCYCCEILADEHSFPLRRRQKADFERMEKKGPRYRLNGGYRKVIDEEHEQSLVQYVLQMRAKRHKMLRKEAKQMFARWMILAGIHMKAMESL